jgi:hypothetical protein
MLGDGFVTGVGVYVVPARRAVIDGRAPANDEQGGLIAAAGLD